jgi:xanthine/CO dehydrogenase XdhC/CoxF family maturation factor
VPDTTRLVRIAKQTGWRVTVADGRANFARPERFPQADRVLLLKGADPLATLDIGPDTLVVLMTHSYPQDRGLLQQILPLSPRYLGLLGPASRTERLFAELGDSACSVNLHAPVGLDLGGETPEALALSIAAEIQAVLSGREGGMLKYRTTPIHEAAEESGSVSPVLVRASETPVCEVA